MTPAILPIFAAVAAVVGVYLPSPYDKDGIGLRVHNLSDRGPYLVGEEILSYGRFDLTLLNLSKATLEHDPFVVAKRSHELVVRVIDPDGKPLLPLLPRHAFPRDPFTVQCKLRPGESSTLNFAFKEFGWLGLTTPGRYRVEATWTIDGRKYTSRPTEFEVVAVPPSAVLVSHEIPPEGREAKRPLKERSRPVIQQVLFGNRILLIHRCHYDPARADGGGYATTRLAELPGKCEMTVEGAYGDWGPLTITYKTSPDAKPTRLVIHSVSGTPWTEADERSHQERLKAKEKAKPPAKP